VPTPPAVPAAQPLRRLARSVCACMRLITVTTGTAMMMSIPIYTIQRKRVRRRAAGIVDAVQMGPVTRHYKGAKIADVVN
jgi:hypothetical protein